MNVFFVLMMAWFGFASLPAAAQSGRTFYIDYNSGSNSNPGTKSAPWKTHPFMQTAAACTSTGSAPSYSHQSGDQFIFKGGVSWPVACFAMYGGSNGGSSSVSDYYGADASWYSGSSFTRPVFDLNYSVPARNMVIGFYLANNITIDNIEIVHQGIAMQCASSCSGNGTGTQTQAAIEFQGSGTNLVVKNSYLHDWVTSNPGNCYLGLNYSAGAIYGSTLVDSTEISGENSWYGPSHTPITFGGGIEEPAGKQGTEVRNSKIHGTMAAMFSVRLDHDNEIYHVSAEHYKLDACPHSQVIEDDDGGRDVIYNNLIHDNQGRNGENVGVIVYECGQSSFYNNVMWNNNIHGYNGNVLLSGDPSPYGCGSHSSGDVANVVNNTIDCTNGVACVGVDSKGAMPGTVNLKNNIFIANGGPLAMASGISTFSNLNNYTMSPSEASQYGFTPARKYAPSSSNSHVAGQGVNLLSLATGVLTALSSDAAGAPWFGGSYNSRAGSWDLGAFVVNASGGSQQASKPNPPSALAASVQ
jgi:hypothetical protein